MDNSNHQNTSDQIPIIDISPYYSSPPTSSSPTSPDTSAVIRQIHDAASKWGFFILTHSNPSYPSIPPETQQQFLSAMKTFFASSLETKMNYDVRSGGLAWRGYMPLGGEHTHGSLDHKEGLYVGAEHDESHPLIGLPLHGKNRMPEEMLNPVMAYLDDAARLGGTLTDIFSLALQLESDQLRQAWITPEPVLLLPGLKLAEGKSRDMVLESIQFEPLTQRADFGYLTILKSDQPGLQVLSPSNKWVDVPYIENSFIINIGDMFDQLTGGRYRSRPHRALRPKPGGPPRYSFPLFYDFAWNAAMKPLNLDHLPALTEDEQKLAGERWKGTTFREVKGTWSQYLARKVQKIFPDLKLPDFEGNIAPSSRFTRVIEAGDPVAN